jgi:hypothetical protein
MMHAAHRIFAVAVLAAAAAAGFAPSSFAQSESDLRRENEVLRARVQDLERELEAARARITALEAELQRLRAPGAPGTPGGGTTPPAPPALTVDKEDPKASPLGLYNLLAESYTEAMDGMDIGLSPDSRERQVFIKALERWAAGVDRQLRSPIEWRVRVTKVAAARRDYAVEAQAIDPKTSAPIGDPFEIALSKARARHLEQHGLDATYMLRGNVRPSVRINPDRADIGPFDSPKLIGPFAEFFCVIDVTSLTPYEEEMENVGG